MQSNNEGSLFSKLEGSFVSSMDLLHRHITSFPISIKQWMMDLDIPSDGQTYLDVYGRWYSRELYARVGP